MNHSATDKSKRMQVTADLIDSKTIAAATGTPAAGTLVIGTSALSGATGVLAEIALPVPSFVESGGVLTLQGVPLTGAASASGVAAKAELRNNAGTRIRWGLTVGETGSGADVIIGDTDVENLQDVIVTAGTLTHGG